MGSATLERPATRQPPAPSPPAVLPAWMYHAGYHTAALEAEARVWARANTLFDTREEEGYWLQPWGSGWAVGKREKTSGGFWADTIYLVDPLPRSQACDCRYRREHRYCKHVQAVVLYMLRIGVITLQMPDDVAEAQMEQYRRRLLERLKRAGAL